MNLETTDAQLTSTHRVFGFVNQPVGSSIWSGSWQGQGTILAADLGGILRPGDVFFR